MTLNDDDPDAALTLKLPERFVPTALLKMAMSLAQPVPYYKTGSLL